MQRKFDKPNALVVAVGLTTCLFLSVNAWPYSDETDDTDKLKARVSVAEDELRNLQLGKGALRAFQEYRRLHEQLNELRRKHDKENEKPRDRIEELWYEEEVQEWQRKITDKSDELSELRQKLQGSIHKRGQELYGRRQKELSALAVAQTPEARALGFTVLDYPRVDGSTSTQPLGMIIACKMLGCAYRWAGTDRYTARWYSEESPVGIGDFMPLAMEASTYPAGVDSSNYYEQLSLVGHRPVADDQGKENQAAKRQSIMINRMLTVHAGTHGAYENVINGLSDIGLVARTPSEDELSLADEKGVKLSIRPFALDAFVFIKNHENPVTNLTTDQIRRIYSGKLKSWSDVGGANETISAYRRNRNSGSQELMEKLVMKSLPFEELPHERARRMIHYGMGGPYIALTYDEHGLGYSVYYYERFMAGSPDTELIAVDGVLPSYHTIQSGEYPYVTKVYAVMRRGASEEPRTTRLRDWLLSSEGQAVIRESGYVPLNETATERDQAQQSY